jgi:hypothetical protein
VMNHCQPSFARTATPRSRLAALLAFVILSFLTTPLIAEKILQPGRWEGEYEPANLGDYIDASFCVQRDITSTPPWTVTMRLDLPPPGNDSVEFEILDLGNETFRFRIDLLKALRECLLEKKDGDELIFKCTFVDSDNENTERLTMERVKPRPDDECQPEIDIKSKE